MIDNNNPNLTALSQHKRIIDLWLAVGVNGLVLFAGLLIISYFAFNSQSVSQNASNYQHANTAFGAGEVLGLIIAVIAFLRYRFIKIKTHQRVFAQLLKDNSWSSSKIKRSVKRNGVASSLLGTGEYFDEFYSFSGIYVGLEFNGLIYQYLASIADHSKTRRFICLQFNLPKSYPLIVVDNRRNDHKGGLISDLPERIPNAVQVKLEGNFDQYYHVITTKGTEHQVVEVLSPDLMEVLADAVGNKVDIELGDKSLFLIYEAEFFTEQNMMALFNTATKVVDELKDNSRNWKAINKYENKSTSQAAEIVRNQIIFNYKYEVLSAIGMFVILIIVVMLMWSHVRSMPTN